MANILIIDDDQSMCYILSEMVSIMGHEVFTFNSLHLGLQATKSKDFDLILLDVRLPDGNGLDAIPDIRQTSSKPEVIIITGAGEADGAELAIRSGAWDYIEKPASIDAMMLPITRALQYRQKKKTSRPPLKLKRHNIIGASDLLSKSLDQVAQAATSDTNVLITGETGTGKELFARAIHDNSQRCKNDFIVVDCTSIPESLVATMLFGHVKGAFTGASESLEGLIKQADGGTLFLDEIGELPMAVQKSFLRVCQEQKFRPLGGKHEISSNLRIIAATNRDLHEMVKNGLFREDLLFRLGAFDLHLPPLRDRKGDIKELTNSYMASICDRHNLDTKNVSQEFFEIFEKYNWPGNVRELINTLEKIFLSTTESTLIPQHIPNEIRIKVARASLNEKRPEEEAPLGREGANGYLPLLSDFRKETVAKMERQYCEYLMVLSQWDIKKACKISGLARARLYELLKKYNISRTQRN